VWMMCDGACEGMLLLVALQGGGFVAGLLQLCAV
jgi:hypothetical protein